jgi:hypothetical protein
MPARHWFADFDYAGGALLYKKTGAQIPLNWEIFHSFSSWLLYFTTIKGRRLRQPEPQPSFKVAFAPDRARPWYLIWMALHEAGAVVVDDPREADLVFHFDDSTQSLTPAPVAKPGARLVNFECRDVSKSAVAAAFEETFGYALKIDPAAYTGDAVEKGEDNGAHDGQIVTCPIQPRADRVYQRLIDNRIDRGLVEDLRTPTLGGIPACVFLKRRPTDERFANLNTEVALARPEDVFSPPEIEAIGRFCRRLGLEWGGLDVLRDAADGRLYIVDANKTDMGPPTALPLADKVEATKALARAIRNFMAQPNV